MPTDWEERYQTGDMPWEKGAPAPGLIDFLNAHPELPRDRVLVPGCGCGHDVRAWAAAGFPATGLDIAPSAIRICRERAGSTLPADYSQGDFLADHPSEPYGWVFEHTLYCAIDPAHREAYCAAVLRWLKPGGHFLAIHYLIPDADGPPFGTTEQEVLARFQPHLTLVESWVPRSYPNRAGLEKFFWWRKPLSNNDHAGCG